MAAVELMPFLLGDTRGDLRVLDPLPFAAVRAFIISGVPQGESRGGHAHRTCSQVICCMSGRFSLDISSPTGQGRCWQMHPFRAIFVPPMHWIGLHDFNPQAVCAVLCDEAYSTPISDPQEYLRLIQ